MKLKPCPFCGGNAYLAAPLEGKIYSVFCWECFVGVEGTEREVIKKWNTRVEQRITEKTEEPEKAEEPEFKKIHNNENKEIMCSICHHSSTNLYDYHNKAICGNCAWVLSGGVYK